jgi:RNA polymerase sigma-70 factor (ECF subfamily)
VDGALTDLDLVAGCIAGDARAERALFDRHVDQVYRTAFRLTGDHDMASDHTQETFIRAFSRLGQFRGDAPFASWLRTITASVVLNGTRRLEHRARVEHDLETVSSGVDEQASFDLKDRLGTVLGRMSDKLRQVFVMHDLEGYTHGEIARALRIPEGTSKGRLFDARALLRSALSDYSAGK